MSADHSQRHTAADHRNEFALRRRANQGELERILDRVHGEVMRLQRAYPHLGTEGPGGLSCRMLGPSSDDGFESALRRTAFGVLWLHALERAETVDPTSGTAA
jgi:hypothetical protein